MTFDDEKAMVDAGYVPTFSADGSRITGWHYPNKNFVLTLENLPSAFTYSSERPISSVDSTYTIDHWSTPNLDNTKGI